jgi:hypothetical protein
VFIALIVISAFATAMAASKRPIVQAIALVLPTVIFLVELAVALGASPIPISQIAVDPKVMLAIPLASFVAWVVVLRREMSWSSFGTAASCSICLLAMPYVFAIGSGVNYWILGGMVAFFWALAALPWLKSIAPRSGSPLHLLPVAALSQLIGFMSLYAHSETPYRQPIPLLLNREAVSVRGSTLLLGPNYGAYFQDLQRISNAAGFTAGTPIIDFDRHLRRLLVRNARKGNRPALADRRISGQRGARCSLAAKSALPRFESRMVARGAGRTPQTSGRRPQAVEPGHGPRLCGGRTNLDAGQFIRIRQSSPSGSHETERSCITRHSVRMRSGISLDAMSLQMGPRGL